MGILADRVLVLPLPVLRDWVVQVQQIKAMVVVTTIVLHHIQQAGAEVLVWLVQ
jgi:hypothetical protein